MLWVTRVLFVVLFVPLCGEAQSLGSIAKKERERREKNRAEGVTVREITEEEVSSDNSESEAAETTEAEGESTDADEAAAAFPDAAGPSSNKTLEDEQRERRRSEAEWRGRVQKARARIDAAREQVQILEGLHLVEGERYVDDQGRTVIQSLDHLRRLVAEAREELRASEQALQDLQDQARRAGVPPGWLR